MSALTRRLGRVGWRLAGRFGPLVTARTDQVATVLVAYHHPVRLEHLDGHLRNFLRCRFVERIVVSNQTPYRSLRGHSRIDDRRIEWIDHYSPGGCGHRWHAAADLQCPYLLVVDDDVLLRPSQAARLLERLVAEPERPHGLGGYSYEGGHLRYITRRESAVDYLCEVYAVTAAHVARCLELERRLAQTTPFGPQVAATLDFAVISQAGTARPRVHDVGRVLRCDSYNAPGVAMHRTPHFWDDLARLGDVMPRHST